MSVDGQGVPFVQPHCLRASNCADSAPTIEPLNKYQYFVTFAYCNEITNFRQIYA